MYTTPDWWEKMKRDKWRIKKDTQLHGHMEVDQEEIGRAHV